MEPNRSRRVTTSSPHCKRRLIAAVAVAMSLPLAAAQTGAEPNTEVSAAAELFSASPHAVTYLSDLEHSLGLRSPSTLELAVAVERAREQLAGARRGLSAVGTMAPGAEHERDLVTATAEWELELELELLGAYRYDRAAVLEAEIAVERAESRWRDQRRADLQAALLALSASRLSALAVEEAELDAAEAAAELDAAVTAGRPAEEIASLTIETQLAAIELEREQLDHRSAAEALDEQDLLLAVEVTDAPAAPENTAWLSAPPSPQLSFPEGVALPAAPRDQLALELALAEHELTLAPFEVLRQVELFGSYESSGVEAGARLALERGVPTTVATLGWQLGEDVRALTFGVGATLRLSDTSSAATTVAHREVSEARAALADFVDGWSAREREQRTLAELAFREFALEVQALDLVETQLAALAAAGGGPAAETASTRAAVRRSLSGSERAWQRYVRELVEYLDVIDVVLETRSR